MTTFVVAGIVAVAASTLALVVAVAVLLWVLRDRKQRR